MTTHSYVQPPDTGDIQERNPLNVQLFPNFHGDFNLFTQTNWRYKLSLATLAQSQDICLI